MPKLKSLSEYFPGLENISVENVLSQLGGKLSPKLLQNQICNRIIYSQTVPVTPLELSIDLAILKEAVKMHSREYYNRNSRNIIIPDEFLGRFPDIATLVWVFVDIFVSPGVSPIFLKTEKLGVKSLGTLIRPKIIEGSGAAVLVIKDQSYEVKIGTAKIITAPGSHVDIKFSSKSATLLDKNEVTTEVLGGDFGIAVDMRL